MIKFSTVQILGPIALGAALIGSELAAYGLAIAPSSEWLWYLNLKWFGMFQKSHYALAPYTSVSGEQVLFVALPILVAAFVGLMYKRTLLLAVSSNLSFVYSAFVLFVWGSTHSVSQQASLSVQHVDTSTPEMIVFVALIGLCFISFIVSHIIYISRARVRI